MPADLRVAIVGSGIAGCSAAAYLRDAFPRAGIHVFEQADRIGGRIDTLDFHGHTIEAGASFFHSTNTAVQALVSRLGLPLIERQRLPEGERRPVGIWGGAAFLVMPPGRFALAASLVGRYGLSLWRMRRLARQTLDKWRRLYPAQDAGETFASPADLLRALDLEPLARETIAHTFAQHHVQRPIVDELFTAISRSIYNQDAGINGFAGMVALLGTGLVGGRTLSIAGGNARLCAGLLERAEVRLRTGSPIARIRVATAPENGVRLTGPGCADEPFDAAIIATSPPAAPLVDAGPDAAAVAWRAESQPTCVTMVAGRLRAGWFGLSQAGDLPQLVLTVESPAMPFTSMLRVGPAPAADGFVYKIQSRDTLTPALLRDLFEETRDMIEVVWPDAYPTLAPTRAEPPFRMASGVYRTGAMESVASTLETQAVASRNVVALLARDLAERARA